MKCIKAKDQTHRKGDREREGKERERGTTTCSVGIPLLLYILAAKNLFVCNIVIIIIIGIINPHFTVNMYNCRKIKKNKEIC